MSGGAGNDTLGGDAGDDVYYFDRDFGQDQIANPLAAGSTEKDVVRFVGLAAGEVLFQRHGNSLKVYVAGAYDVITFETWYGAAGSTEAHDHVSSFKTADLSLSAERLDAVVALTGAPPVSMWHILMGAYAVN